MIKKGDKELADAGITDNPIAMSLKSAKTKKKLFTACFARYITVSLDILFDFP